MCGGAQHTPRQSNDRYRIAKHIKKLDAVTGLTPLNIVPFDYDADITSEQPVFGHIAQKDNVSIELEIHITSKHILIWNESNQSGNLSPLVYLPNRSDDQSSSTRRL